MRSTAASMTRKRFIVFSLLWMGVS
jgi:hypothetical protein